MEVLEQQLPALKLRSVFFFSFLFFLPSLVVMLLTQGTGLWLVFLVQCPTAIVPFFGDQPFWGDRVHARGVGPAPIPVDQFSLPKLVDAIKFMLDPKVKLVITHLCQPVPIWCSISFESSLFRICIQPMCCISWAYMKVLIVRLPSLKYYR